MYFDEISQCRIGNEPRFVAAVPAKASWADNGFIRDFPKVECDGILSTLFNFYVFNTFVPASSSQSVPLFFYGWKKPWSYPERLQRKLKDSSTNQKLYYSAEFYEKIPQALQVAELDKPVNNKEPYERACFYNSKKNQTLSLFAHIRNSFCHGRFASFYANQSYWILMEDVAGSIRGNQELVKLTARLVLRLDTLNSWIDLIQKGPDNADN